MQNWTNLTERVRALYTSIRWGASYTPVYLSLGPDHVDVGAELSRVFEPDQHYFQVRMSEMFLAHTREWLSSYDPVVFAVTEFLYDTKMHTVPRVIGPHLLDQYQHDQPRIAGNGTRFINTPVSGLHPYVGGDFAIIMILYQAKREDHLRNLLKIVEKVVGAVDPSIALKAYMNMAEVILDGLDMILGTGKTKPVVAVYHQISASGPGQKLKPGYYALIDAPEKSVEPEKLWIRGNRLCMGDSMETSSPYREHDFVLFSIVQADERSDVQTLAFFPLWRQVQESAIRPDETSWEQAKAGFRVLWRELLFSPDLTRRQKNSLKDSFQRELKRLREQTKGMKQLGAQVSEIPMRGTTSDELEVELDELGKMLNELG